MSLFTCKKYVFLIEKSLPNFSAPTQNVGKLKHNALYGSRSRMGTQFYRGFVVIPTDLILRSKYLWGWLWLPMNRVVKSSYLYFIKIESDSGISQ
ncbi:hypothetical protein LEP1GSC024_4027 [Leptospira noguchii str. 2001034031]|uniref:Uncharacterized protein n=1 Tax=Leptospira noguchii str. 2001034031 TaxID=1193053 RepID=M6XYY5_9LEPT|nr:hypothetical protein LEP1GSC024_4027 [Leptospira noguchii str. 2001034031]